MSNRDTQPFETLVTDLSSRVTGPVDQMMFADRSLLFCELSILAYTGEPFAQMWAKKIGFTAQRFLVNGFAGYLFVNDTDVVISFRGINVRSFENFDEVLALQLDHTGVHPGFKAALEGLWKPMAPVVAKAMVGRKVWTCGHSLGGAMGVILDGLCRELHIEEIYSYGAPRPGSMVFTSTVKTHHHRWVNHHDIVPHMPPVWKGYSHQGEEHYLNRDGLRVTGFWGRLKRLFTGIADWMRLDSLSDHSIFNYRARMLANQESANGQR